MAELSATQVTLKWDDNSGDERGFRIERAEGDGAFVERVIVGPDLTNFTDNITIGVRYSYRVSAYNNAGSSAFTNVVVIEEAGNPVSTPAILTQPIAQTVAPGGGATFTTGASGTPAPSFQWRKDGVNLANGGNIFGATSATLVLANVTSADAGTYSVVAANANLPDAVSTDALLTVNAETPPSAARLQISIIAAGP